MEYKDSYYPANRSDNYEWVGMDKKELFEKNCKKYPNNESLKYYKENPIKYSFNNFGFRTPDDFNDTDEGNIFLGCSHTMGIGHLLENTWAYKVNKEVGGKFWNLSQGGCGIQTDYRLLLGWKDTLKIKNIFHYTIPWPRYEFLNEKENIHLTAHTANIAKSYYLKFYLGVLSGEEYCNYNQKVHINAIRGLSQEIGCNYYYLTPEILGIHNNPRWYIGQGDDSLLARDLTHPTVGKQNYIYEKFLKIWENING